MAPLAPVVLIVFNRPLQTTKVFESIRLARPETLLVVADGPRKDKIGESNLCDEVREIISRVDWPCQIYTNYSDENLGCKKRVSSGLDWVFSLVDRAIILEDDCLPDPSFYLFCTELLEYYKDDQRIMQICGSNFLNGWKRTDDSYYYSLYGPIWGWASWKRAWKYYDVNISLWPQIRDTKVFEDFCLDNEESNYRYDLYEQLHRGEIDTWDYQWGFAKMLNSGLSIIPNQNLITNIGFGEGATHTNSNQLNPFANMKVSNVKFPLRHPKYVLRDKVSDRKYLYEFAFMGRKANAAITNAWFAKKIRRFIELVINE